MANPKPQVDIAEEEAPKGVADTMSDDDIAATLGLLTTIGTNHMKSQMPQEAPQETETAPVEAPPEPPAPDLAPEVEKLQKEVETLQKEIKKDPKDQLAEIRKMVEDALAEPDDGK